MSTIAERYRPGRPYLYWVGAGLLLIFAALVYLWRVPSDPPGFYIDESSICYNAHTISQTGHDEYGTGWPLFFRAFGEYKNPTLIYILAFLFKVLGPSIALARICTAVLGLLTGILLGFMAWRITRHVVVAAAVAVMAWLTPWLFESSRVVLEVAMYPCLVALFLLATWRASRRRRWTWGDVLALAASLALLTYSYSIGRLLGPLLLLGLLLLFSSGGWRGLVRVWLSYGVFLIPLFIFHQRHPGALTNRFKDLTYLTSNQPVWTSLAEFVRRYGADINPWRWLVTGGTDVRDHLPDTGSMLAVPVLVGVFGLAIVLRRSWRDPWWRFVLYGLVVAVVPGALTRNEFAQLRLIAFPVFFLVFTIPAVEWSVAVGCDENDKPLLKRIMFSVAMVMVLGQGICFQWLYHRRAPDWWYVFDARFPRKILARAVATGSKPLYLVDELGKSGYIQALWHGVLTGLDPKDLVRLPPGTAVPAGAVAISSEEDCRNCRVIARSLNYIVYATPPYPDLPTEQKRPLNVFSASIAPRSIPATFAPRQKLAVEVLVKNTSSVEWPAVGGFDGQYAVKLAARWGQKAQERAADAPYSKRLPFDVEPRDTVGLALEIAAPAEPGDYTLEIGLMQDGVGWFADHGSAPWTSNVRVTRDVTPNDG